MRVMFGYLRMNSEKMELPETQVGVEHYFVSV
jgi:hypothetical protein